MHFIRTKTFKILALIAVLVALYALAGFWLAPKLARSALLEDIPRALPGVRPSVGIIRVNPFLLTVGVNDFSLADPAGEKLLSFDRLFVAFELSSLWHRAYSFANIDIDKPVVNAVIAPDGQLNLLKLSPEPRTPPPKKNAGPDASIPRLRIGSFKVSQASVAFDDRSHPSAFVARLEPINFELREFTTGVDGGRFTFTGASRAGERFEWHGHVSVQPIESDGEFRIDGLEVRTLWDYLEDKLNFAVNSGRLDASATYKFSLQGNVDLLHLDVSRLALTDLAVRPKDAEEEWINVPQLLVADTNVNLSARQVDIRSLTVAGLKVQSWIKPDGSINLMQLAALPPAAAPANAPAPPATMTLNGRGNTPAAASWQVNLRDFALQNAAIYAEDRSTTPTAKVQLAPLSAEVHGISLDLAKPIDVSLDAKINDAGSLNLSGQVTPSPAAADLHIKLAGIELAAVQPYIGQRTSMTLQSGALSGETTLHYGPGKPGTVVSGDISIANLHAVDNALHDDFIKWDRLDVRGLKFQQSPNSLDIEQVIASKAYARVIIEPDSSINVKRVLAGPGATVIVPGAPGSVAAPVAVTAAAPPISARMRRKKAAGRSAAGVVAAAAGVPAAPAAPTAAPPALTMTIKKIALQNSEADFSDLSVKPNFTTGIKDLQGSILGVSSKAGSRAKIDLQGDIDAFSPVKISGDANFLSAMLSADMKLNFENIELSTFNPYSGKFAGYNIAKGKLTTELHYKVEGRKLDAQHHIVVDQLEFGDKTESKEAVSLPIKLAVALMKDRNGIIDLQLPVTGSLDDPQFKLGPLIWKFFLNVLEKAVTAPFALIGSLFGGGPDLQFIDFDPGDAALDPAAADKAHTIVKALTERPQLKIEVPIAVVAELDRQFLVDAKLNAEIKDAQSAARKKSVGAAPFEQLDPAAKLDVLAGLYRKDLGSDPKYPDAVADVKVKPELATAKINYLTQELRAHVAVTPDDLTALGQQRAMNLQQLLLQDTQVDPARVFLVANDKAKNEGGKVRLELSLR